MKLDSLVILFCFLFISCYGKEVHTFYYLWYGNPEVDGDYKHWNHEVLPHWEERINTRYSNIGQRFNPPNELHSPYYPLKGPYSSADPQTMREHFNEILNSGIDVLVASWWGQESKSVSTDTQGVNTDRTVRLLLETASNYNRERLTADPQSKQIKIAFHLEPYPTRSIDSVKEDIIYIIDNYGSYSSFYRNAQNRPLFYVYDSYHIPSYEWGRLLTPAGDLTIRSTKYDSIFIGLWLEAHHGKELVTSGFNGIYSYFATDGFSFASNSQNWKNMCKFCLKHKVLCSLSVGPGYNDALIRPWNEFNARDRENGKYYEKMWKAAIAANPDYVSITSFNEWGEGTQIEPAKQMADLPDRIYPFYSKDKNSKLSDPFLYLNFTKSFSDSFRSSSGSAENSRPREL